jgi:hypothetical protein
MSEVFHEARQLWQTLKSPDLQSAMGGQCAINYQHLHDPEEIFCDSNSRPLSLESELTRVKQNERENSNPWLRRMIGSCNRGNPNAWTLRFFLQKDCEEVEVNRSGPFMLQDPSLIHSSHHGAIDCLRFTETMSAFEGAVYIGPFRNAIKEGAGNYLLRCW